MYRAQRAPTVLVSTHLPKGDLMTMTIREAFEKGTDTYNAHDIDGFAEVLAPFSAVREGKVLGGLLGPGWGDLE
jgi:hypothetical protein